LKPIGEINITCTYMGLQTTLIMLFFHPRVS
jgi:hypothetical protein